MILLLAIILLSYLVGSMPTSIITGRVLKGIDIREHGSGNAGGTNVYRVVGLKAAIFVTMVDIFKGWFAAAVIAGWTFGGALGTVSIGDPILVAILCGAAAVLGHTYTIFGGFRGGKGVGTLAGMLIYLFPVAVIIGVAVWALLLMLFGYVSLSSVAAVTLLPIITYAQAGTLNSSLGIFSVVVVAFIWWTHRSNIVRLKNGNENRFEKAMILRKKAA